MSAMEIVKKVKHATLMKDASGQEFIRIDCVRFSFPFFGEKRTTTDEKTGKTRSSWQGVAMLDKNTHKEAKALIVEVIEKLIAKNEAKVPKDKWFITNGDDKEGEEMQGQFLVSFAEGKNPPAIRDNRGQKMERDEAGMEKIDDMFFGGSWGHILIRPWYFNGVAKGDSQKYPKRISAGFAGAFFWKNDTPFGAGRIDDTDAWGGVPTEGADGDDGMGGDDDDI